MATLPAEVSGNSRKPRRFITVVGVILFVIGLAGLLFSSMTSFQLVAATAKHSFTIIEDDNGTGDALLTKYAELTRERYEQDKENINLELRKSGNRIGAGADDGWLWVRAKTALAQIDELSASGVNVEVEKGVITLTGSVSDPEQAARAEAIAKRIEGVRRVVNKLTVSDKRDDRPKANDETVSPEVMPFRKVQSRKRLEQTKIEVEWPRQMNLTEKGVARVSIMPDAQASATPVAELPNNEALIFDPTRCNTPNANLRDAYGSQYEASAVADLTTTAFNVTPGQTGAKSLAQSQVTFTWDIEPKSGGSQPITLRVSAQWKHKRNNQTKPECEILNRSFPVVVKESIISTGNLTKASAVITVLGAALALPIFPWNKKGNKDDKGDK